MDSWQQQPERYLSKRWHGSSCPTDAATIEVHNGSAIATARLIRTCIRSASCLRSPLRPEVAAKKLAQTLVSLSFTVTCILF